MKTTIRNKTLLTLAAALLLAAPSVRAEDNTGTGGTITYTDSSGLNPVASPPYAAGYVVHKFTSSGTLTIPVPANANVLVVGGGGGGGKFGGGGGAGGFVYMTGYAISSGSTSVTIGTGGSGATSGGVTGGQGSSSVIGTLTASGGGGGGSRQAASPFKANDGSSGGSGGGASPGDATGGYLGKGGAGTTGQGNAGGTELSNGWGGCGGGGAGVAGGNATGNTAGNGGAGLANSISGASVDYAGGGGGCTYSGGSGTIGSGGLGGGGAGGKNASGVNGTANTGGGGGGGDVNAGQNGGNGGSGIVIVRYPYDPGSFLISLASPANNQIFSSTAAVSATASVFNGTPPYTVNFYLDGNTTPVSTTNNAPTTVTVDLGVLSVGSHTVEATVTDSTATTVSSGTRPFTVETDITAPTPNPMTFAVAPASHDSPSITMTATTATDALSPPVQYYFENTTNSVNSGWISGTVWTNTGLSSGTTYGYRVKARDAVLNETAFSATLTATSAFAPPVQTKVSSATELAYSAEGSTSDLLNGLMATATTGWNNTNGANVSELNDGIHGGTYAGAGSVAGAWTTVGATAEYNLGIGTGGAGYNITSIQSIAAWNGAGFGNQAWTVEVKPVGGSWTTLSTVNYQPLAASAAGATKVTLTDPSGVLASGIQFIRFTANQVNGGANAGAFVWRELDVFGIPTVDVTAPTVAALSPADDTTAVPAGTNLVATFNENIASGTGNITIKNLETSALTVIPVGDSQVSISGAVLTINPNTNLASSTNYAIQIDASAIKDLSNNPFAGIAIDTTWNFTTGVPDLIAPTIITRSPVDNATNVLVATNLVLTFNENIALGSGNITIKNLSTATQTVIPVGDPQISVSGAVLTINPTVDLAVLKNYAIRIDSGAITDLSANPFAGIADDTSWNFTSASTPLRIMCLGDSITVGYTDNPSWANHPFMFGYRSGLYTRLTNAGYNFKLVGGSTEPWTGISGDPTHGGTYTPALDLRTFAQDGHRGYGGQSIGGINGAVAGYIAADTPDVILLLIGINGIGSGSPAALNTLVNTIVTAAPNARLIVAQITPLASFNQSLYDYNIYIRDTLVPSYVAAGKKVSTVNLYSLFLTNPSDYSSAIAPNVLSNGINHPDNPHYDLMAGEWFKGIDALGLGPNTFSKWIAGFPGVGALTGFNDDPDGDGNKNGLENFFGTSPSAFTTGVIAGVRSGNTFTFTHPQNATPASDVSAAYQWSKDLATFRSDGQTDGDGTTVNLDAVTDAGVTTVTATVTGTATSKLFVRVKAEQP